MFNAEIDNLAMMTKSSLFKELYSVCLKQESRSILEAADLKN